MLSAPAIEHARVRLWHAIRRPATFCVCRLVSVLFHTLDLQLKLARCGLKASKTVRAA